MVSKAEDQEQTSKEDVFGMKPEQWRALAEMKIRRLDREYQEVLNAQIRTDPDDFKGLAAVLRGGESEDNQESTELPEESKQE